MLPTPQVPPTPVIDSGAPPARRAPALSLRVNFSWTLLGNLTYGGCLWGMLMVLTKLGSPDLVGQFALASAITAPVLMFSNLQMRTVQASDAREAYGLGEYLGLRLITTGLALAAILVIVALWYGGTEVAGVIVVMGLAKASESVSDILFGALQQRERMDRIAISMIIKGLLSLVVLAALVCMTGSMFWGTVGLAGSWFVVLVAYDIPNTARIAGDPPGLHRHGLNHSVVPLGRGRWLGYLRALWPRWSPGVLGRLAWLGLPLGFVMCLTSLNSNLPRYFIESQLGMAALGIFAPLSYVVFAGTMVVTSLGQSAVPRLARYYACRDRVAFRDLLWKLVLLAAAIGVGALAVALLGGSAILTLMYSREYAEHTDVFCWVMAAGGLMYVGLFLGYGMMAARYFRVQPLLFLAVGAATAAGCALLVPRYGLLGAAWAMLAAAALQIVGSGLVLAHAVRRLEGGDVEP